MPPDSQNILSKLNVQRLPSLPHVLVDMLRACQGSQASFQELAQIISKDVAISARVIALANSSFFRTSTSVNSLERALLVLGIDTIKTIVITASVQQFFSGFNSIQHKSLKRFWKHSLKSALLSKSLAILTSYPNPEEAYLSGLLHNIGELVFEANYGDTYTNLRARYETDNARLQAEQDTFSIDHAKLGALLVKSWGLSDFTGDAIEFHHSDSDNILDAHHLTKLVYLASFLSNEACEDNLDSYKTAEQLFELNPSLVREIIAKIDDELVSISASLDISFDDEKNLGEDKHIELARHVRNISLLQTASGELNNASSKSELTRAVQSTLELLFDYPKSLIFWFDSKQQELSATSLENEKDLPITVKLSTQRSIIAQAANKRETTCSFASHKDLSSAPVIDQQLIRQLGMPGMLCIPVKTHDELFCVIATGNNQALTNNIAKLELLELFAHEVSLSCEKTLKHISDSEHSADMTTVRQRAREIAHEVNNPLNIINNYLAALSEKLAHETTVQEELLILREEVQRASHILLRLRDIEHSFEPSESDIDINQEIESLVKLYDSSLFLGKKLQCVLTLDPSLRPLSASRTCVRQILTNLIKNAAEALTVEGIITISTTGKVNVNGKSYCEIAIKDNGPGISQEVLDNLFEPVTSTKGSGHSGLGLSITKNLVKDAKGSISCRTGENGTRFQILLPYSPSSANETI